MSRSDPSRQTHRADPPALSRLSAKAGFTLIEIVVAFVITALAVGALYRMSSTGLETGSRADRYNRALLIAEAALEGAGITEPLVAQNSSKRVEDNYDQEITVRPRPDLLPKPATRDSRYPYEVSVVVSWRDGRRNRSVTLSALRLGTPP
jgi:general secretion pathway protein I